MQDSVLLVGCGYMAIEYAKVFKGLGHDLVVVGRGEDSAEKFKKEIGITPITGGLASWLENNKELPSKAIVAVTVDQLAPTTLLLLEAGIKSILLEKPGGGNRDEILEVARMAEAKCANIYVAYNRRFYAATQKALKIIEEDGGVLSFNFEFTEWSHLVGAQEISKEILEYWFMNNSSHVVDLAFFLGGKPKEISSYTSRGLPWHPAASVFVGAGVSDNGALFSYQANWEAPGRWGVEILTSKHRLIFRPMEQLHIQVIGSIAINKVEIDDQLDTDYKPGLYKQVEHFLNNNGSMLCAMPEQQEHLSYYNKICPYK